MTPTSIRSAVETPIGIAEGSAMIDLLLVLVAILPLLSLIKWGGYKIGVDA